MRIFPKGYVGNRESGRRNWNSKGNGKQCTNCQGHGHYPEKKSKGKGSGFVDRACKNCNGTGWK